MWSISGLVMSSCARSLTSLRTDWVGEKTTTLKGLCTGKSASSGQSAFGSHRNGAVLGTKPEFVAVEGGYISDGSAEGNEG